MNKFTAGPWTCDGPYGHHGLVLSGPHGEDLGHVRAFIPTGDIAHGMQVMQKWGEGQANAALIVAAPDMLKALRRAVLALAFAAESSPAMRDDYEAVSAAIAKATGSTA